MKTKIIAVNTLLHKYSFFTRYSIKRKHLLHISEKHIICSKTLTLYTVPIAFFILGNPKEFHNIEPRVASDSFAPERYCEAINFISARCASLAERFCSIEIAEQFPIE